MLLINEDERDVENDGQVVKIMILHHLFCCNITIAVCPHWNAACRIFKVADNLQAFLLSLR